jgi:uncharacterized Zn-finger protein
MIYNIYFYFTRYVKYIEFVNYKEQSIMPEIEFSEALEIKVNSKKVCCDGRNGSDRDSTGHPIIYLSVEEEEPTRCPYCNQVFVYDCTVEQVEITE